jgi:2-polyprenyl-3-methyl-5-hydroxy-6-metoxy-1,4-benzoquinol methylase
MEGVERTEGRLVMIEATGERFIPELMGGQLIEAEHVVRYALGADLCAGKQVLDAGCGVGWGTLLLLESGAAGAAGIDIDLEAVEEARKRVPGADIRQGDLAELPWPDESFELVVCFEAVEHVHQQERVLDELVRVLSPGGILMVSSPNPRVYPAGNPFHVHELTPEELQAAARSRLPHVTLLHQHEQMASVLVPPGALKADRAGGATSELRLVHPLVEGGDPYSLVVASRRELPSLPTIIGCAPSVPQQLVADRTQALAGMLDHVRVLQERARYPARRPQLPAEWEREREELRHERDRLGTLLLECEQKLADVSQQRTEEDVDAEVAELRLVLAQLEREYAKVFQSTSWRLTKPIRMLSRLRRLRS